MIPAPNMQMCEREQSLRSLRTFSLFSMTPKSKLQPGAVASSPSSWAAAAPLVHGLAHFHKWESSAAFHDAALDAGAGVAHTSQG